MNSFKNNITKALAASAFVLFCPLSAFLLTSCKDFMEQDNDHLIYADKEHLNNASDTIYSVMGIINNLQVLADRTILLGEVRGDLVDLTNFASSDLRDVANFSIGNNNRYNQPRDYYAVINNCNYFIEHADTALRNSLGERVFQKEYAAVKAYRAWTYLQLAMVYGRVPFITEPIIDMEDAEQQFPMYDIQQICDFFIQDLQPHATSGFVGTFPGYNAIRGSEDSRLYFFPVSILLGELNLWGGHYREAAQWYYYYLQNRNGTNTSYPLGTSAVTWSRNDTRYQNVSDSWSGNMTQAAEIYSVNTEIITMLPGDSVPTSKNYSELANIFNTTTANNGYYALTPSRAMIDLSAAQRYCNRTTAGDIVYPPTTLDNYLAGDLRLMATWKTYAQRAGQAADKPAVQNIEKYDSRNVHLWRRSMVYLHFAEALNRAGFPRFAWHILATGVNNNTIETLQRAYPNDSIWLSRFDFPNTDYVLRAESLLGGHTTLGVHAHGSGFPEWDQYYTMPTDSTLTGQDLINYQIERVEDMIVDEEALELAFEGQRFYDLMRVSLRRGDPSYLASRVLARRGKNVPSGITANLLDTHTWYLRWNGQNNHHIGY